MHLRDSSRAKRQTIERFEPRHALASRKAMIPTNVNGGWNGQPPLTKEEAMDKSHRGLLVKIVVTVILKIKVKIDRSQETGQTFGAGLLRAATGRPRNLILPARRDAREVCRWGRKSGPGPSPRAIRRNQTTGGRGPGMQTCYRRSRWVLGRSRSTMRH